MHNITDNSNQSSNKIGLYYYLIPPIVSIIAKFTFDLIFDRPYFKEKRFVASNDAATGIQSLTPFEQKKLALLQQCSTFLSFEKRQNNTTPPDNENSASAKIKIR